MVLKQKSFTKHQIIIVKLFTCLLFLFAVMLLTIGCGEGYQHKKAKKTDTVEVYEKFIKKYPESKHLVEVKNRIMELEYEKSKKSNKIEEYENFLKKYPEGKYSSEISRILLDLRYKETKSLASKDAYKKFLIKHPNSKYSNEISILLNPYSLKDLVGKWKGKASNKSNKFSINLIVDSKGNLKGGGFTSKWSINNKGEVYGRGSFYFKSGSQYTMVFTRYSLKLNYKKTKLSGNIQFTYHLDDMLLELSKAD